MELTAEWELQKRLMKFNTQQQKPYTKKKETHLGKKRPKNKKRKTASVFRELWDNRKCLKLLRGKYDRQHVDLHLKSTKKLLGGIE